MAKLTNLEVSEICNKLGELHLSNISKIHGGDIHNSFKLDFQGKTIFLKKNIRKKKFLKYEYLCLKDLDRFINHENLKIPTVYSYLEIKNVEFLILEWIDMYQISQAKLGQGLAEMHLKSNESNPTKFGNSIDGFIGLNEQISGWESNWADCFINLRIEPQLQKLNDKTFNSKKLNDVITKIKLILSDHIPLISLVHGDLWSGNVGISKSGKGIIFDPACWWADCEVDIAMSLLFGGFKEEFYTEYFKLIPKKKGFENRVNIYNFYHVLNHANMFGGSYLIQAKNYIDNILRI